MKLLLDQNLSPRLVQRLVDLYADATHVSLVGLNRATDSAVWEYARANDCIIVTKDADFSDTSVLLGSPPKVIWLRLGNCTTSDVEQTMRRASVQIAVFAMDTTVGMLELI
jgi:predicted nuclease of predicted toxin-antitoxin system